MVNFLLVPFVNGYIVAHSKIHLIWSILAGPTADHISGTYILPSNLADVRVQAQPRRLHLDGRVGGRGRGRQPQGVRPDVPPEELRLRDRASGLFRHAGGREDKRKSINPLCSSKDKQTLRGEEKECVVCAWLLRSQ